MLVRRPDWRARLAAELDAVRSTPFAWGSQDCLTGLVGGAIKAMTDADPVCLWRGRYSTQVGALRVLRNDGFTDLAALTSTILPELKHPSMARMGDVLAIPTDDPFGYGLAICDGERVFVMGEDDGLMSLDRAHAVRAWRVG